MLRACETRTVEGQYVFATCADTGAEGIFSGSEEGTFTQWEKEHNSAHMRLARYEGRRLAAAGLYPRGRKMYGLTYSGH